MIYKPANIFHNKIHSYRTGQYKKVFFNVCEAKKKKVKYKKESGKAG
jgi:hypothetical protein